MVKGVEGMTFFRLQKRRLSHELIAVYDSLVMETRDGGANLFLWCLVVGPKGMIKLNQGISEWALGERSLLRVLSSTGTAPWGTGHGLKPVSFQEAFGQCS